jgi:hypothetical protein
MHTQHMHCMAWHALGTLASIPTALRQRGERKAPHAAAVRCIAHPRAEQSVVFMRGRLDIRGPMTHKNRQHTQGALRLPVMKRYKALCSAASPPLHQHTHTYTRAHTQQAETKRGGGVSHARRGAAAGGCADMLRRWCAAKASSSNSNMQHEESCSDPHTLPLQGRTNSVPHGWGVRMMRITSQQECYLALYDPIRHIRGRWR